MDPRISPPEFISGFHCAHILELEDQKHDEVVSAVDDVKQLLVLK